ncbi:MAG: glycoside hydrolase family 97 N-terminal domain-containing protein, partial [Bacteroidota bacterium]|nr:glycoside hydrolase family 97 N-terminal domain-containing protein [Bacteroidota bacterium]
MSQTKIFALLAGILFATMVSYSQSLKSPNGNLTLTFDIQDGGVPTYQLSYKGKAVIKPSHLGLELKGEKQVEFGTGIAVDKTPADPTTSLYNGFKLKN